jgi:hypothetical protein
VIAMGSTLFWSLGPAVATNCSRSPTHQKDLVTESLSTTQWRVCDDRFPDNDTQRVLGFIEITKKSEFEVMSLVNGFEWFTYPTLAEAIAHFAHARSTNARLDSELDADFDAVTTPLVE